MDKNMALQLLIWRDPTCLIDVVEVGTRHGARTLASILSDRGFDERTQSERDAAGDLSYVELRALETDADGRVLGDAPIVGTWRVDPGQVPTRCRRPRACVTVDAKTHDLQAFCGALYAHGWAPAPVNL